MPPPSWIGQTIGGRHKIETLLGQGGMSAVYSRRFTKARIPICAAPSPQMLIDDINRLIDPSINLSLPWDTLGVRGDSGAAASHHTTSQITDRGCFLLSDRGDKIPLTRREVVIGRSAPTDDTWVPDVDVRQLALDKAKTVSRFHCRIFIPEDGVYRLMDMGSFNGTWLNGRRLESKEAVVLGDGDQIHLGGIAFRFHDPKRVSVI